MSIPSGWKELDALPADADTTRVLGAARTDLERCAQGLTADEDVALPFTAKDVSFDGSLEPHLVVTVADNVRVVITASALVKARDKRVDPVCTVASGLARQAPKPEDWPPPLDQKWRAKRVGGATGPTPEQMRRHRRIAREPSIVHQVKHALEAGEDVMIVGKHGSGRTATAAVAAEDLAGRGYGEIWLNLTDPGDGPESVVAALMQLPRSEKYVVVVDGLQANFLVVAPLLACVERLRTHFGLDIRILATSLNSIAEKIRRGEPRFPAHQIRVNAETVIRQMTDDDGIRDGDRRVFRRLVGQDVHIAAAAIDMYRASGKVPTEEMLQEEFTKGAETPQEQAMLYRLACLGALSLGLPEGEARAAFGQQAIERLLEHDLVHRTDGALTIAPQRRARLVLTYARTQWRDRWSDDNDSRPEDIVWTHLQRSDRLIRATLNQIDYVNIHDDTLRPESLNLLAAWDLSERLVRWLEIRTDDDRTWGNNLASAVFAGRALSRMHRDEHWLAIADHLRTRWHCDDPEQRWPEPVGGPTTDLEDFEQIAETMAIEDRTIWQQSGHPSGVTAADFDKEKAYRAWALGLLLCFEGSAPLQHRDEERIDQLLRMAARAAEDNGAYYPARIPWVTARVLMGIGLASVDPSEHRAVGPACQWLIGLVTGPDSLGLWWRGGTGAWNSDEATTAMCAIALTDAEQGGRAEEAISTALAWLKDQALLRERDGREIDLAQVVEAFVRCADDIPVHDYLMPLLQRTTSELEAKADPDYARPEERLRLPFLAAQLTEIVWRTVRSEFRPLLQDVMGEDEQRPTTPQDTGKIVAAVPEPAGTARPCGLTAGQLRGWRSAAQRLEATLTEDIRDRESPSMTGAPSVQVALEQYLEWQNLYFSLLDRLDHNASRATLTQLDALGKAVCGRTWPGLTYPETYCDEDAE